MIPPVILIHGRKGAGKDTLAGHLQHRHGYFPLALADILKHFLEEVDPLVPMGEHRPVRLSGLLRQDGANWDTIKRDHQGVRDLLTAAGQGARNAFGEDFWVNHFLGALAAFREEYPYINRLVVTDIRYENELLRLKHHFGDDTLSVRLLRPGHDADGHPSEIGLPDKQFDMVLENDADIPSLTHNMDLVLGLWAAEPRPSAVAA